MDGVDGLVLTLLAFGDLSLFIYLRRRRARRMTIDRISRSFTRAVRRELAAMAPAEAQQRTGSLRGRLLNPAQASARA